ncbi:MAG: hypothetical protein QW103_01935 [Candidatus Pacearchaeota archaeon]
MKNRTFLFALVLVLFTSVNAFELEKIIVNDIAIHSFDNPAEFIFKFKNAESGLYEIFTFVDVKIFPNEKFLIDNLSNEISVKVYPTKKIEDIKGRFSFVYYIKDPNYNVKEDRIRIILKEINDIFEIYSRANPLADNVSFYLENKENVSLKNITIKASSILFEENITFDINPFEKKEFFINVDKEKMRKIPAGSYLLEVVFISPDQKNFVKQGKIILGEKRNILEDYKKEGFIIKEEVFFKKNLGNVNEDVQFSIEKNFFISPFLFFNEKPDKIEREGFKKVYYWNKRLSPLDSYEIKIRTNYLYLILFLILLPVLYYSLLYYYKGKVSIKKYIKPVKTKSGDFAVKVKIHLKALKNVKNVSLIENYPSIFKLHNDFGLLKPDLVDDKKHKIKWNAGELMKGEEKIFSYVLYTKLGIYGKLFFPKSVCIYEYGNKVLETSSNKVFLLSEQIKKL